MAVLVLVVVGGICEGVSYYILRVKQASFYLSPEYGSDVIKILARVFSYELGWEFETQSEAGYRGPTRKVSGALIALFGDSFVYGHDDLEKSWAHLLEKQLQSPVLNFGVDGYGPDQALWRFEKRFTPAVKTPLVCLGIMSENIGRIVNAYRMFYGRKNEPTLTKPMYVMDPNGQILLQPNPLTSSARIGRLNDMAFLTKIGQTDYWYRHFKKYRLNQRIGFPYASYLLKALPYYVKNFYQKRIQNKADYKILYQKAFAVSILEYIVQRFIQGAVKKGAYPIILFMPNWKDMVDHQSEGQTVYQSFFERIRRKHSATFDAMTYFDPLLKSGQKVNDFFISYKQGHYNPRGEAIVAQGFYRHLMTLPAHMRVVGNPE